MTKLANKLIILSALVVITLASCNKIELLKSEDQGQDPAGANLANMTIWEWLSMDNFHANDSSKIGMYGKAIEHAGLKDLLNGTDKYTVIIPSNAAMVGLIATMGYSNLSDVPPIILKNILSSTITKNAVRSFDLGRGETKSYVTINADSLYLTRRVDVSDEYILIVNASPLLSVTGPIVRTQNLEFKNGVGHVVPTFTYYLPKTNAKDPINPANVQIITDTIPVTKDAYMNAGTSANVNYGNQNFVEVKTASINFTKRAIMQVPVRQPSFSGRIGSIELSVFFSAVDAGGGSVDFYEDANVDWVETSINWNNAPTPGNVSMSSIPLTSADLNKRFNGVVTPAYLRALTDNLTFLNIGLNSAQANRLRFQSKQTSNVSQRPYLLLKSAAVTLLTSPTNTGITLVKAEGIKSISSTELNMQGTTPNNIFYTLTTLPANGFVVVGGLPLTLGSMFSQEQVNRGLVKYLFAGTGTADSFKLEASDFQNGFYPTLLDVNVTFQ